MSWETTTQREVPLKEMAELYTQHLPNTHKEVDWDLYKNGTNFYIQLNVTVALMNGKHKHFYRYFSEHVSTEVLAEFLMIHSEQFRELLKRR